MCLGRLRRRCAATRKRASRFDLPLIHYIAAKHSQSTAEREREHTQLFCIHTKEQLYSLLSAAAAAFAAIRRAMSAEVDTASGTTTTMIINESTSDTTSLSSTSTSSSCSWCSLESPPSMILQIPPPPVPAFLMPDYFPSGAIVGSDGMPLLDNDSFHAINAAAPCRHSCQWRGQEGVHYVEMPQQGNMFDDTWLLVLISSCVGVVLIGVVLATMLIKCKFQADDVSRHVNDDASQCSSRSNKNSTLSTSTASSSMQTTTTCSGGTGACLSSKTIARLQHEAAVLYPCAAAVSAANAVSIAQDQDSRVMWATLTPRGTTRHYLEEHTYETIGNVCHVGASPTPNAAAGTYVSASMLALAQTHHHHHPHHHQTLDNHKRHYSENHPTEHVNLKAIPTIYLSYHSDSYNEPTAPSPVMTRPKDEKAFDNTAFVDYEEPHTMKNEYYQLDDVLEPCDPIFSVQGMYGMPARSSSHHSNSASTLRPRVSSPTRIEHPNLPPLNRQPTLPRSKHRTRKNSVNNQQQQQQHHHPPDCSTLLRGTTATTYIPTI